MQNIYFSSFVFLDMFKKHGQDCEHPEKAQFDIYAITSNSFDKFQ